MEEYGIFEVWFKGERREPRAKYYFENEVVGSICTFEATSGFSCDNQHQLVISGALLHASVSSSGIAVPDATATLMRGAMVIQKVKSNTKGDIWIENVPAGKYSMSVAAPETKKGDFVVQVKPESQPITVIGGFSVNVT